MQRGGKILNDHFSFFIFQVDRNEEIENPCKMIIAKRKIKKQLSNCPTAFCPTA
jgi:hypothetical protein